MVTELAGINTPTHYRATSIGVPNPTGAEPRSGRARERVDHRDGMNYHFPGVITPSGGDSFHSADAEVQDTGTPGTIIR